MPDFIFEVEKAKSGRAGCRGCRQTIAKDTMRCGAKQDPDSIDPDDERFFQLTAPKWYHLGCMDKFRKQAWMKDNFPEASSLPGYATLSSEDQTAVKVMVDWLKGRATSRGAASSSGGGDAAKDKQKKEKEDKKDDGSKKTKKRKKDDDDDDDDSATKKKKKAKDDDAKGSKKKTKKTKKKADSDDESSDYSDTKKKKKVVKKGKDDDKKAKAKPASPPPPTPPRLSTSSAAPALIAPPKPPVPGASPAQLEEIEKLRVELGKKPIPMLKEMLKENDQMVSGKKDELVDRVAEGKVMGAMPKCTKCGGGRLHWNGAKNAFLCKGYHDDTHFVFCNKTTPVSEVQRRPWKDF